VQRQRLANDDAQHSHAQQGAGATIFPQLASRILDRSGRRVEQAPTAITHDARWTQPLSEAVLLRQCEAAFCQPPCDCRLAAQRMQDRGIIADIGQRVRMLDRIGAVERRGHAREGRVSITKRPQRPGY
jgi:hypothetical protein